MLSSESAAEAVPEQGHSTTIRDETGARAYLEYTRLPSARMQKHLVPVLTDVQPMSCAVRPAIVLTTTTLSHSFGLELSSCT